MTLLHDAYAALLSGITIKIANEIDWFDEHNDPITVEPIDIPKERYILRRYYKNGRLCSKAECQNEHRHGLCQCWYKTGQLRWEEEYKNGQRHGLSKGWRENGQLRLREKYQNGMIVK